MARGRPSYFDVEKARIEIIPMIDIMMFLLIFFIMITLKMIAGSGIKLELPGSSTAEKLMQERIKVTIGVDQQGNYAVDGERVPGPDKIRERLQAAKQQAGSVEKVDVIIAGDKKLELQLLVKTMDIVRAEGVMAVGIATRQNGAAPQ
jgi:biopolymer transport protein ExbD